MNIDERLEKLAHRRELTAAENRQHDRRMAEVMEGITCLLHIAEHRTDRLESGDD